MAKAKKSQSESSATGGGSSSAGKSKGKKTPAAAKSTAKPVAPLVDTSLAAQTAAKMVANRDLLNQASPSGGARSGGAESGESESFRRLRQGLLKPTPQGPAGLLQNVNPSKKSNQPFGGRNQIGHNQTFGADVNRTGVPRRTGG